MPTTPWIPALAKIKNGEDVSAEVVNKILAQYTQRTQHLYEKFEAIDDKGVLVITNERVFPAAPYVSKNSIVYYNKDGADEGVALAKVDFVVRPNQTTFAASNKSYGLALVRGVNTGNTAADLYLMGMVELDADIDDPINGLLQSSETSATTFEPGPLFLSRTEEGKVTRNPGGIAIYIGYAFTRRRFLLAPNVSEFNQFFTTYRYNVLDRTAGKPSLSGGTWAITQPDLTKVGWIGVADLPAAYTDLTPEGAKFFYNLPDDADIEEDTGLIQEDQDEQQDFSKSLPPNPPNLTMLIVNGVIQEIKDVHNTSGVYLVNDVGIWWFDDTDGNQPWASDIETSVEVTADFGDSQFNLTNHGFVLDDIVVFNTTTTLPTGITESDESSLISIPYYVTEYDANNFKVSLTKGGAVVSFSDAGVGTLTVPQPYIWKTFHGTNEQRPRTTLHFIRINPSLRSAIVTSIKPYNTGSNAIEFYLPDKSATASSGDLLARLQLDLVAGTAATSSATALKSLNYDETTGKITTIATPIISKLSAGTGTTITQVSVDGTPEPGSYIISSTTNNSFGRVDSIEPDGAELLFTGLHSYINMTVPSTLPSSIVGKITLPANVPNADMTFVMLLFGADTALTTKSVEFEFTYAITKKDTVLSTAVSSPIQVLFNMPSNYSVAKTCFKVGNTTDGIATPTFKIPASAFSGGDAAVNFRLYRKQASSTPYTAPIGIVDLYWKIG